jgi:hypothetical protein
MQPTKGSNIMTKHMHNIKKVGSDPIKMIKDIKRQLTNEMDYQKVRLNGDWIKEDKDREVAINRKELAEGMVEYIELWEQTNG